MTQKTDRKSTKQKRADRLAEALRANLKRRKSQARERRQDGCSPSKERPARKPDTA